MAIRSNFVWASVAAVALFAGMAACGDDETSTTATTTTTTTTGGGSNPCGEPTAECTAGCDGLWTCTQADDAAGNALCPGLKGAPTENETEFKCACTANALCAGSAALVNTDDCTGTIGTIKGLDGDFKTACEGAPGTGGGGGTSAGGSSAGGSSAGGNSAVGGSSAGGNSAGGSGGSGGT